jgi:hypothetical protein
MSELLLGGVDPVTWQRALLSVLVAYLLSQAIAAVYVGTHRAASYSRSFVVSLVAAGLVSSVLMLAIGNNLARGLGIVGTLALIRFRTNLFDPLDTLYVFASFGAGVAAGTGNLVTGAIGTGAFLAVVATLQLSEFGARRHHDGVLRLQLAGNGSAEAALSAALGAHCRSFRAISLREVAQGLQLERVYQVNLRDPRGVAALVEAVAGVEGASGVSISMQEATHEL